MGVATGITLSRVDFSDPQGGKGPCDRKAATIKAHVRRFINEGHDVQTAEDLETAMLSAGGLNGIRVALVDSLGIKENPIKWDGKSLINNLVTVRGHNDDSMAILQHRQRSDSRETATNRYSHVTLKCSINENNRLQLYAVGNTLISLPYNERDKLKSK